jgi:hypothetical protein
MRVESCAQNLERIIGTEYAGGFISERHKEVSSLAKEKKYFIFLN